MAEKNALFERRLQLASNAMIAGGGAMTLVGIKAIKVATDYQLLQARLLTVARTQSRANQLWQEGVKYAAETSLEVSNVIDMYTAIVPVADRAGISVLRVVKALADTAGALGITGESMNQFTVSMSRGLSGTGSREVRLWTRGLIRMQDVAKDAEKAGITIGEAYVRALEKQFQGGQARMQRTLFGAWSNLKDTINISLAQVGEPALKPLENWIRGMTKALEDLSPSTRRALGWIVAIGGPTIMLAGTIGKLVLLWRTLANVQTIATAATEASTVAEGEKAAMAGREGLAVAGATGAWGKLIARLGVLVGPGGIYAMLAAGAAAATYAIYKDVQAIRDEERAMARATNTMRENIRMVKERNKALTGSEAGPGGQQVGMPNRPSAFGGAFLLDMIGMGGSGQDLYAKQLEEWGKALPMVRGALPGKGANAAPAKTWRDSSEFFKARREQEIAFLEDKRGRAEQLEDMAKVARVEDQLMAKYREGAAATAKWIADGTRDAKEWVAQKQAELGWISKIGDLQATQAKRQQEAAQKAREDAEKAQAKRIQDSEEAVQAWLNVADVLEARGRQAEADAARMTAAAGYEAIAREQPGTAAYYAGFARAAGVRGGVSSAQAGRTEQAERDRVQRLRDAISGVSDESRTAWAEFQRAAGARRDDTETVLGADRQILADLEKQRTGIQSLAREWGWLPEITKAYLAVLDKLDATTLSIAENTKALKPAMAGWGDVIDLLRQASDVMGGDWTQKYIGGMRSRLAELGKTPFETGEGGMPTADTMNRAREYLGLQAELNRTLEGLSKGVEANTEATKSPTGAERFANQQYAGAAGGGNLGAMRELMARTIGAPSDLERAMAGTWSLRQQGQPLVSLTLVVDGKEMVRSMISANDRDTRIGVRLDRLRY